MQTTDAKKLVLSFLKPASARILWRAIFKRAFDLLASGLGMIFLTPFLIPVVILLRREGLGPIFYRGSRTGRGGKPFTILKFRTMYECPESYNGPRVTAKGDERITPLGRWLRDTKLNELPQLWNVLVGEMSMVGPRPEDPAIANTWPLEARAEILSLRPGITSPASVLYRDEESQLPVDGVMDTYIRDILPDKLRLDLLYVRNHSFLGDLDILFWTVMAVLPRLARQRIPESKLFAGPLYLFVRRHVSWFILDLAVSLLAVAIAGVLWRLFGPIDWGLGPLSILALILAALFSSVNVFLGLDRVIWSRATAEDGLVLTASTAITIIILLLANYLLQSRDWLSLPPLPNELIILLGVFILVSSLFARYRMRLVNAVANRFLSWRSAQGGFGERVLILGAGDGGQVVSWLLRRGTLRQVFKIVGMLDDDPAKQGMRIDGCWVLGGTRDIPELVRKHDIGVILFTITNISPENRNELLRLCDLPRVRLVILNDVLQTLRTQLIRKTA